ncbi:efflux RND transporter periplasmic adaptor subunit [Anabaena cylindrica FACHB-243]|uniref:Efflux transporter, RND family, MFP subunit n=1 Tax=Anabaena cylindrica (strain ATCC 27899 / PCC 7122) TaxID=272123 RepID=K9ZPT2_ANACC|nr:MULTISPECIES: efflux RND transporter periplasmic adaptor subunit [Anabaena]AFZ61218.1 efflux transporter, RND family, MFP subunit [Anabaena cylindrica PCC 7122]MBD2421694.1 efflux RND transporter periplasmic adaptor subunit [Anabaena cylindrica FACHB-243]MBY5280549.1 efflux RND transporter periplasmic adaptor subunit [Anabaena sp. CCAP 1446/1C]MBY5308138.1 efflux RND transporter periplasmic adaptor subunit [Anabaena sp. CCAP 1446/1C]MCM2405403.1 efflux RND transporter periplasmic adaptor su
MNPTESQTPNLDFEDNFQEELQLKLSQKPWLWLLTTLLLVGGGITGWRVLTPSPKPPVATAAAPPGVPVKLSTLPVTKIEQSSNFIANLKSRRSVNLRPRIQGQVSQIFVKAGDEITAGTPILQIDAEEKRAEISGMDAAVLAARSQLENAQATLKVIEAERLSKQADVKLNELDYQRYSYLANEGAISRQTQDQYANKLATAKASLNAIDAQIQAQKAAISQAQKTVQQAQAATKQQQVQLKYYQITAPFAGKVGDIPIKIGDFVDTATQLATITENQTLEVNISVPVQQATRLRPGMTLQLIDERGKNIGSSRIFFIAANTVNDTQSVLVKSLFDNSRRQLRSDQLIKAKVIWEQRPGVLIPTTTVIRLGAETFVYVAEKSPNQKQLIAKLKPVKLGNIQNNQYQILKGLSPGEKIVISGLLNLKDGTPIIPE